VGKRAGRVPGGHGCSMGPGLTSPVSHIQTLEYAVRLGGRSPIGNIYSVHVGLYSVLTGLPFACGQAMPRASITDDTQLLLQSLHNIADVSSASVFAKLRRCCKDLLTSWSFLAEARYANHNHQDGNEVRLRYLEGSMSMGGVDRLWRKLLGAWWG
jgi:hypothetical protein